MPENALQAVDVDYQVTIAEMSSLVARLSAEMVERINEPNNKEHNKTAIELEFAIKGDALKNGKIPFGELSPYACPECHGVLSAIKDGDITRYRCHTGHAYSADSLLYSITENIGNTLWNAIRGIEESIILLNNLGDHHAEQNQPRLAAMYFKKASEAEGRAKLVRQAVFDHEQLHTGLIKEQVPQIDDGISANAFS
jgi:two-component system chemotaxis response regulator CheB